MTTDIYKETILDHYRHPRNYGDLPNANAHAKDANNLCGDVIEMQGRVNAGIIEDVRFRGEGCAISMATASMLTEFSKRKRVSEVKKLGKDDLIRLLGADPGPARIECALLALSVLKAAVNAQQNTKFPEEEEQE
ncbi:MAG: iron-sulfur cluster assembly scaffold protein [Candidatus Bathyarchaeia archaeon]|jgi:nitrogen fixation NifU-like protein